MCTSPSSALKYKRSRGKINHLAFDEKSQHSETEERRPLWPNRRVFILFLNKKQGKQTVDSQHTKYAALANTVTNQPLGAVMKVSER